MNCPVCGKSMAEDHIQNGDQLYCFGNKQLSQWTMTEVKLPAPTAMTTPDLISEMLVRPSEAYDWPEIIE